MRKLVLAMGLSLATLLSACGGGGGSAGNTQLAYTISLRADKTTLPLNIDPATNRAGIGAYSPYTTTLYVEARENGAPIIGTKDAFACNMSGGLDAGALYYLDGKSEHQDDKGNAYAYRSITLDSNSGGNSFHFHSADRAGTSTITCSVTNPRDNKVSTASVNLTVGAATGRPASVRAVAQAPGYLGTQGNLNNIRNNVGIQAFVMDDANQPVPNPTAANLQVTMHSYGASLGARLLSDTQSGSVVQVRTSGGVGQLSLSSGSNRGVVLLEFTTDRADNNVSNGIQDPVAQFMAVSVVDVIATAPLAITSADLKATNGLPFAYALEATGGVPPYTWAAVGGLPAGLSLGASGVISGTPLAPPGAYSVSVQVTDGSGTTVTANVLITLAGALPLDPLVISGCTSAVNTACPLPVATAGASYLYAFSASGGDPALAVTWTYSGLPAWLTGATTGSTGVVSGTAPAAPAACGTVSNFLVTATRGTTSVTRQFSVTVGGTPCP